MADIETEFKNLNNELAKAYPRNRRNIAHEIYQVMYEIRLYIRDDFDSREGDIAYHNMDCEPRYCYRTFGSLGTAHDGTPWGDVITDVDDIDASKQAGFDFEKAPRPLVILYKELTQLMAVRKLKGDEFDEE